MERIYIYFNKNKLTKIKYKQEKWIRIDILKVGEGGVR